LARHIDLMRNCFLLILIGACLAAWAPAADMAQADGTGSATAEAPLDQRLLDELAVTDNIWRAREIEEEITVIWRESGSASVDLLMARAEMALSEGKRDTARELYDRAILILPEYAEAWQRRAQMQFEDEAITDAMMDLSRVVEIEPRHFAAWTGLAQIFEQVGAEGPALEAYASALAAHPNYDPARQGRARLVNARGERAL
jgi:tetratricopeptide (TPR) repeat protein